MRWLAFLGPLISAGPDACAEALHSCFPHFPPPKTVYVVDLAQAPAEQREALVYTVMSLSGLAARAVAEGRPDWMVWLATDSPSLNGWLIRTEAAAGFRTVAEKDAWRSVEGLRLAALRYVKGLKDLPKDVKVLTKLATVADVIQCFVASKAELEKALPALKAALAPKGILWIAYPKRTSKVKTDIHRDIIREAAAGLGLQTVAMFSIDGTWSSLRLKIG